MKLVKIAAKKSMLAFDFQGNGEKTWTVCSKKVYDFVKANFKEGDYVSPTFGDKEQDGMKYVTLVKKGAQGAPAKTAADDGKPKCEDCGYPLKDAKYKKCYKCNQKDPAPKVTKGKDTDLIKREAVAHATSRVMIGLQGQYDINNVKDVYEQVYKFILDLVEGK